MMSFSSCVCTQIEQWLKGIDGPTLPFVPVLFVHLIGSVSMQNTTDWQLVQVINLSNTTTMGQGKSVFNMEASINREGGLHDYRAT